MLISNDQLRFGGFRFAELYRRKGGSHCFRRLLTRRHVRSTMRNLLMTRFSACLGELQMKAPFLGARPIKMRLAVHALGILKAQLK